MKPRLPRATALASPEQGHDRWRSKRRSAKKRKKERTKAAAGRQAVTSARKFPDRRARFAEVTAVNDGPVDEETFAVVVEPIRLDRGDVLMFQSPHVPPFEAFMGQDRGLGQ